MIIIKSHHLLEVFYVNTTVVSTYKEPKPLPYIETHKVVLAAIYL